jgi:hypothetical protein
MHQVTLLNKMVDNFRGMNPGLACTQKKQKDPAKDPKKRITPATRKMVAMMNIY